MNRILSTKLVATAALALGVIGAASAAHARSDVFFTIGVQPTPVYVQHRPAYVEPQHVYVEPVPAYGHDRYQDRQWDRRSPYGDRDGDGIANRYDRDNSRHHYRYARHYGPYGDIDRDGIRNQDDRDRDGDGIRNRNDRFPDNPNRR
jgi:hypothetical protein